MRFLTAKPLYLSWVLLLLSLLASCQQRAPMPKIEFVTRDLAPLPQDPLIQVYFNQSQSSRYTDPYRQQTRWGDNFEKLIVNEIAQARSSIDVAVQELRLPNIATALVDRYRARVKVRVIVENLYNRPGNQLTKAEVAKLSPREREHYQELFKLVDVNRDGKLSSLEIKQRDALTLLKDAGIPLIDDTADGSKGSDLMHHKFLVVDGKHLIVTSANWTLSDIHGDFRSPTSRGNPNNLLKIESAALAKIFTEEFNLMWGDGPGGKPDSKFGLKKPFRPMRQVKVGKTEVRVQFSPTSRTLPWEKSVNGLIGTTLAGAEKSVDLALFVFSAQRLADILATQASGGVTVRSIVDPSFAYRPYSEALDMMGVTLLNNCQVEVDNRPWQPPLASVGVPQLPKGDRLHHKFGVVDGSIAIVGSHNWTEAANSGNDETLLTIANRTVATHFEREFERLYQGAILGVPKAIAQKIAAQKKLCAIVRKRSKSNPRVASSASEKEIAPSPGPPINLNTANRKELETLPGVGPKLAEKIVVARQQKPFDSLEDVDRRVSGVGQKMIEKWHDRVTW